MIDFDDSLSTFHFQLQQNIRRLRGFARLLTASQHWAELYVVQLLREVQNEPSLLEPASTPRVALWARLLQLYNAAPQELGAPNRSIVTPTAWQAHLLMAVEGFTKIEAAEVLKVSVDQLECWVREADLALAQQTGARIMIVEDEAFVALELEFLVGDLGHQFLDTAATQSEAVDKALVLRPDLILSDVQLADGGSGIEAARLIRTHLDVPFLFITANPEDLQPGRRREPVLLIKKPFNKIAMRAMISQALFVQRANKMAPQGIIKPNECNDHTEVMSINRPPSTGSALPIDVEYETGQLINKAVFAEYVSTRQPKRLIRTLAIFVAELDGKVGALSAALKNRDVEAIQALTHSMFGSAVMLGAERLVALSAALQREHRATCKVNWARVDELRYVAQETALAFKNLETTRQIEDFLDQRCSPPDGSKSRQGATTQVGRQNG